MFAQYKKTIVMAFLVLLMVPYSMVSARCVEGSTNNSGCECVLGKWVCDASPTPVPNTSGETGDPLLLHLNFDDGTAKDLSTYKHTVTPSSGVLFRREASGSGYVTKYKKNANSYLKIPDYQKLSPKKQVTVVAWIKPEFIQRYTKFPNRRIIQPGEYTWGFFMEKDKDGNHEIHFYTDTTPQNGDNDDGWKSIPSGPITPLTQAVENKYTYIHVVGVYDGSMMRLYINGEKVKEKTQTGELNSPTRAMFIGGNNVVSGKLEYPFIGGLDDIRIYSKTLSGDEIKAIFDSTNPNRK